MGDLATDPKKRAMFTRLAKQLARLADEVEQTMGETKRS